MLHSSNNNTLLQQVLLANKDEEYRLPSPLVHYLRACKLTGKPTVQTDLQETTVKVVITWNLLAPPTKRSRKTRKRKRREPALSSTLTPSSAPVSEDSRQKTQTKTDRKPTGATSIPEMCTATTAPFVKSPTKPPPAKTLRRSSPSKSMQQPTATSTLAKPKPPTPPKPVLQPPDKRPLPTATKPKPTTQTSQSRTATDELNMSFIDLSREPQLTDFLMDDLAVRNLDSKYQFRKGILHTRQQHGRLTILQARRLDRPGETLNIDLSAYFVKPGLRHPWILLKGPTNKYHVENWWNYIDNVCAVAPQMPTDKFQDLIELLHADARSKMVK